MVIFNIHFSYTQRAKVIAVDLLCVTVNCSVWYLGAMAVDNQIVPVCFHVFPLFAIGSKQLLESKFKYSLIIVRYINDLL